MSEYLVGIDEQIKSALVAAQLDFANLTTLMDDLRSIQAEVEKLAVGEPSGSGHDPAQRVTAAVARALTIIIEAFNEKNSTATARVRALQDALMDRLSIVDALEAKVVLLEKRLQEL